MPLFDLDKPLTMEEKKFAQMTLMDFLDEKFPKRHGYATSYKSYRANEQKRQDLCRHHRNLVNRFQRQMKKSAYNPNTTQTARPKQSKMCVPDGRYAIGDHLMSKTIMSFGKAWINNSGIKVRYAYLE